MSKNRRLNMKIHKAMIIPDRTCKKKFFVIVNSINSCKLIFTDPLWLTFSDQTQPDIVVFAIIFFDI